MAFIRQALFNLNSNTKMKKNKKQQVEIDRKNLRRQTLENKNLDKKEKNDDSLRNNALKKELKNKMRDLEEEELWEEWKDYYK
jgi:hypothetical protein